MNADLSVLGIASRCVTLSIGWGFAWIAYRVQGESFIETLGFMSAIGMVAGCVISFLYFLRKAAHEAKQ